jgi:uncharacterized protein
VPYQLIVSNSSRDEAQQRLRNCPQRHYVYVLLKPCGTPFYVGKGIGARVFAHESAARNTADKSHKLNTIRALHTAGSSILYSITFCQSEADALTKERELIQLFGRHDSGTGPLTNLTDGGEGPANFSEETRQKHRNTLAGVAEDGSARSALNAFYLKLGIPVGSVPIKPLGARRLQPLAPHPNSRSPSDRQAAALAALTIGNRKLLGPNILLKRRFEFEDGSAVLENGVGRDLLKSGMLQLANAAPGDETFSVTEMGHLETISRVGREVLLSFGVLMPEI